MHHVASNTLQKTSIIPNKQNNPSNSSIKITKIVPQGHQHLRRVIYLFIAFKHLTCVLYLSLCALVFVNLDPSDIRTTKFYGPEISAWIYFILAGVHVWALLVQMVSFIRKPKKVVHHSIQRGVSITWKFQVQRYAYFVALAELLSQSYQAFEISKWLANRFMAMIFLLAAVVNIFSWLWQLMGCHTSVIKVVVYLTGSICGFIMSCALPLFGVVFNVIQYQYGDANLADDNLWYTKTVLFGRLLVTRSPIDLVSKICVHLGTIISLHRLESTVLLLQAPTRMYSVRLRRSNIYEKCFFAGLVLWGVGLLLVSITAGVHRVPCPLTCVAESTPLFDSTCRCLFAHVNCNELNTTGRFIDEYLDADALGLYLFTLQISACEIPDGLPQTKLERFSLLNTLDIEFTKMKTWNGTLPPELYSLVIRHSLLPTIPHILIHEVPPSLTILHLESIVFEELPAQVPDQWVSVITLLLVNVTLSHPLSGLDKMIYLSYISFANNRLQVIPDAWQDMVFHHPKLRRLILSGNEIENAPEGMLQADFILHLDRNPIQTIPTSWEESSFLYDRYIILDETPYCIKNRAMFCWNISCAEGCLSTQIKNYYCHPACFNEYCDYDGGDCVNYLPQLTMGYT